MPQAQLVSRLAGVRYDYAQAATYQVAGRDAEGINLSQSLLYVLLGLLIVEQLFSYSASYHPPAARGMAAPGGRR
jgi:hypothetical protein